VETFLGALLIVAANVQLVVSGCAAAPSSNIAVRPSSAQLIQLRITHLTILPAISGDSADISIAVLKATGHKIELLEYHVPPTATGPISSRAISGQCTLLSPWTSRRCSGKGCSRLAVPPRERQTLRTGPNTGKRVIYVRDPDGTTIELMQLPSPAPTELLEIATR
jgi:catechol 2,3-dioxygenase-like lactoylglutathione lyase family enzyme